LFKPFFKTQSQQSADLNPISHGLGIHISKKIAMCLGGDLTATSEVNIGTIFKLSLSLETVEIVLPC
jgi:signal transduction histidine kinase